MRKMTIDLWDQLQRVQREVNARVKYRADIYVYQRPDFWTVANNKGDCEDYAMAKRNALRSLGWSDTELRLAVCRDENGDGHCVLTIDSEDGTFVLDNRYPDVMAWASLPYSWVSRQVPGRKAWERVPV